MNLIHHIWKFARPFSSYGYQAVEPLLAAAAPEIYSLSGCASLADSTANVPENVHPE